jgi:hypothetical protein
MSLDLPIASPIGFGVFSSRDSGSTSIKGSDQDHLGVEMSGAPSEPTSLRCLGTCLYGYAYAANDLIAANDGAPGR